MENEYNESKSTFAQHAFETLCQALDNMKWSYNRDAANRTITTSAVGDDMKINLRMVVSEDRQLMYIKSKMPFDVPVGKRDLVGRAVNIANFSMLNGSFEFDEKEGYLAFKIVVPHFDCRLTTEVYRYAIILTCSMADKFNDKFLDLINEKITLEDFRKIAQQ